MKRFQIAIIVETMNEYGRGIIRGICRALKEYPTCTIFYEERTLDSSPPSWLSRWKGDGIIVRDRSGESCQIALKTPAKIVDLSERRHPGIPTVISDHAACSVLAATYLKDRGFYNFGFVGIKSRPFSEKRRDAFLQEVGECSVFELPNDELAFSSWGADHSRLIQWLNQLPKPVGIMACYDLVGVRVLQSCNLAGIGVPDSVAVIGVNNDELQCTMTNPSMSSVVQNQEKIGYEACVLLHRLMRKEPTPKEPMVIPPVGIVSRRSTDVLVMPDTLVVKTVQLIREHACEGMTIASIAAKLRVSRRTLERRFFKSMNKTLHDEIIGTQIKFACELLSNTRLTLESITKRIGFHSTSHFSILFEKLNGMTPNEYRKKHRIA